MKTLTRLAALALSLAVSAAAAAGPANPGPAPDFKGIGTWLNSAPLTMAGLKGKVVLVDFWTYTCINGIRTLPYVTKWYDTYKDKGLVVVGVHTPEYAFERKTENVKDAIGRFKINYPIALDNRYVYTHFGEGDYAQTEAQIRRLLAE